MEAPTAAPPPTSNPSSTTKHYVFVDEYNRQKRLKVMRACDGCRKRKIRCDGALQNGPWPCGACVRLKLKCVPPTLDQDDELLPQSQHQQQTQQQQNHQPQQHHNHSHSPHGPPQHTPTDAGTGHFSFHAAHATFPTSATSQPQLLHEWSSATAPSVTTVALSTPVSIDHNIDTTVYSSDVFGRQLGPRLDPGYSDDGYFATHTAAAHAPTSAPAPVHVPAHYHPQSRIPPLLRTQTQVSTHSSIPADDPEDVEAAVKELSEQMGDLTVDHLCVAPWIANQKKSLEPVPLTVDDADILPAEVLSDPSVRIPDAMMPDDDLAMDFFGYFFKYIHPYVPVLNRNEFYEQWHTARDTIPVLILEGIFACVARYLRDVGEVRKWLALASKHEENFKDVPRISTIQAMLLLTKAKEHVPQRGYYYRSWMSVKYMTSMGIDLGLHEHHDKHRFGDRCSLSQTDCMMHTRIWQTLFALEIAVGPPQGRTDFSVELESLDLNLPLVSPEIDTFEYQTSRRTTFMTQCLRNIKQTNNMWQSLRRQKKDWALDPQFVRHNDDIAAWLNGLPADMQIRYEENGSPPHLNHNDHFVAFMHIYHHLIVIMHHRPQLQALLEKRDTNWRSSLNVCLRSGMLMCQLQEALFNTYGLHGLDFMVRGINFSIYCVLTCTMLHLAAITSPDYDTNETGRRYFTRHMRILEYCTESAREEVKVQINALREAFSIDTSKPFELKPTLGLRSPALETHPTPLSLQSGTNGGSIPNGALWTQVPHMSAHKPIATSSEHIGSPYETMGSQSGYHSTNFSVAGTPPYPTQAALQQVTSASPQHGYALEPVLSNEQVTTPVWDPSGIFNHWNTAFGGGAQQPPPQPAPTSAPDPRMQQHPQQILTQQPTPSASSTAVTPSAQHGLYGSPHPHHHPSSGASPTLSEPIPPSVPTVTPHMWQDVFTNAYVSGHGQKRYREDDLASNSATSNPYDQFQNKRRG